MNPEVSSSVVTNSILDLATGSALCFLILSMECMVLNEFKQGIFSLVLGSTN